MTPAPVQFPGVGTQRSLAGRVAGFFAVLALHAVLVAWLLQTRQDLPEVHMPERVFVQLLEVTATAPPAAAPEPLPEPVKEESPPPAPARVRALAPAKPPPRSAVREAGPRPPLQTQAVESSAPVPRSVPAVTEARYDADYLNNPPPVYPVMSRRKGEQGKVLLRVQVSAQGTAERVVIHAGSGYARLDSAALEAVKRWRFVPARRGNAAVAASVVVPIVFRLGDE